ncbi:MAG TPA: L,D-transpeptidase family protein [Sphingobacteriaceae bacterium]|nr:L,D-transpeptidase family protein [Sphingobacteriaceae bacterium]
MKIISHCKRATFLFLSCLFLFLNACKSDRTFDEVLYKASKNKIYKEIDTAELADVIEAKIKDSKKLANPKFLLSFYNRNGFQPVLLNQYLPDDQLKDLSHYLKEVENHGLSKQTFDTDNYLAQLERVLNGDAITTIDEAYEAIALLEIQTAENLLNYSNTLNYGLIDPTKVFKRYYMETQRPDTNSMYEVLATKDLKTYLDSIQPKSEDYKILQKALASSIVAPGKSEDETKKTIKANLERLRWKHSYDSTNMVYVNIPSFKLTLIKEGKPVKEIITVVGTGRNNSGNDKISKYSKPVTDAPHSHETPVLSSLMHSVQVNPVWNIPKSIASKEILGHVQNDRFYLVNNGIEVLEDGKVIDSDSIDWSSISQDNLPFRFRQKPGDDNALGKIKFLFKNNSAVYLHDTPAQAAFDRDIRASSHGCVRVKEPLDLAHFIFGDSDKFRLAKSEIEGTNTSAKDIALDQKVTVVLDYVTTVVKDGKIEFFPDIYGLDIVLYTHLMK